MNGRAPIAGAAAVSRVGGLPGHGVAISPARRACFRRPVLLLQARPAAIHRRHRHGRLEAPSLASPAEAEHAAALGGSRLPGVGRPSRRGDC
ncbi:MAG: hypothetical protein U0794_02380 [Isosphaeraceae bacterium]